MTLQGSNGTNKLILWLAGIIMGIVMTMAGVIWNQLNDKIVSNDGNIMEHLQDLKETQKELNIIQANKLSEIKALVQSNASLNVDQAIDIKLVQQKVEDQKNDIKRLEQKVEDLRRKLQP